MAVTVSGKNYTQISGCESTSDGGTWEILDTQDSVNKKEGTYSLCGTMKSSGINTATFTPTSSVDLSGVKHLRMWFLDSAAGLLDTQANGGIQLGITDGTNTGYWNLGGNDTYEGGWLNLVVDTSSDVDVGTKPTNMGAITVFYLRITQTAGGKNFDNVWGDNLCVCDGLIAYGDDAGGYFDFEDIYNADNTSLGIGILRKIGGVYYSTGSVEYGDSGGTSGCKFQAKSQVLVFEDRPVNTSLYGFNIVDNGTGTTEFILGTKVGSAGVQGCTIRTGSETQIPKFYIDGATDTDVDNFKLYGSTFFDAGSIEFPLTAATVEVLSCNFESCLQVDPSSANVDGCFFINTSDTDAALLWNENIDISDCSFIGNTTGAGVEHPSAAGSPYTHTNLTYSGNTYDVNNTSGSEISINNAGSNGSSYTGSVVNFIANPVTLGITVKDLGTGSNIESARVFVYVADGSNWPYQDSVTIVRSGSTATVTHNSHELSTGDKVFIEGADQFEYNGVHTITKIDDNSYLYTVSGTPDTPATGTITSTLVIIEGLTNASGYIGESRAYGAADQPISGVSRKASASPYYESGSITGTIDKDSGLSLTVQLARDE